MTHKWAVRFFVQIAFARRVCLVGLSAVVIGFFGALPNSADAASASTRGWISLAPLPDPVGFAGMAAGVVGGEVIALGGSNFPLKPLWLQGEKAFNDRIYVLSSPEAKWRESSTRFPAKRGGFASASAEGRLFVAGGLDAVGCSPEVYQIDGKADALRVTRLPDLPRALGYPAGAVVGKRFYVIGGLPSATATVGVREVWSLDVSGESAARAWRREPDLPGSGTFVAGASGVGETLYVFGGMGTDRDGKYQPSNQAAALVSGSDRWESLPPMPEPRVGPSVTPHAIQEGTLALIGGYAEVYPGKQRDHPGFSQRTLTYRLATRVWSSGPELPMPKDVDLDASGLPGPMPMLGAPCVVWKNLCVIISGEVRPSVRSPMVMAWPLSETITRP